MSSSWLAQLGLARKAGALSLGADAAERAVRCHKARLILIAADAGKTTLQRIARLQDDHLPVLRVSERKQEFGAAVGKRDTAVATVTDLGFAASVCEKLAVCEPQFAETASRLRVRQERAARRRAETERYGKKSKRRTS